MKGFRTILVNGILAVAAALATYIVGIDWTQYVSATWALIIVNVANIVLRFVTNTPALSKE